MEEQKKSNDIEEAASALIANAENENTADQSEITPKESKATEENDNRIFKKYRIKDIVFLAIITACTLITGAVMPLLVNVPLFGIVQLGLGLSFSIFPVIGMMKVSEITDRENYLKEQSTEIEDICTAFSGTLPVFSLSDVAFSVKERGILNGVTFDVLKGSRTDRKSVV